MNVIHELFDIFKVRKTNKVSIPCRIQCLHCDHLVEPAGHFAYKIG